MPSMLYMRVLLQIRIARLGILRRVDAAEAQIVDGYRRVHQPDRFSFLDGREEPVDADDAAIEVDDAAAIVLGEIFRMGVDILLEMAKVDIADPPHHGGRAHRTVFLAALDEWHTGACGDIAVSGGVDHDLCQRRLPAGFVIDDNAFDLSVAHQWF